MNDQRPVVPPAGLAADESPPVPGRRSVLKALTLGVPGALAVSGVPAMAQAPASHPQADSAAPVPLRFFNAQEAALMDAIAARLIPADELGPGAKEAGVTHFLDGQLAGAWGAGDHLYRQGPFMPGTPEQGYQLSFTPAEMYRRGLAAFDAAVRKKEGKAYEQLAEQDQDAWLVAMQKGELDFDPLPAEVFFQALLEGTLEGFFSDPLYGGNRNMVGWQLVGFPGAYASFSNDIERHGVAWQGKPVSIAQARGHQPAGGSAPSRNEGGGHG
ncbi:MAG: gluconate 2-dehydrogenase subunit 3 family protein [Achromobacter sp.]|uniref:gluconate 2-dehydrogenase subunit 3 family protein n=1 Tax=Achromobacter sp. TaxID=134375 RepID=UPI003D017EC0